MRVGAEFQVIRHAHLAEELAPLGNKANSALNALLDIEASQIQPLIGHEAARWQQTDQGAEQRRLAGAVRSDDGDDLTLLHGERDAAHGFDLAIGDVEVRGLQHRGHATPPR